MVGHACLRYGEVWGLPHILCFVTESGLVAFQVTPYSTVQYRVRTYVSWELCSKLGVNGVKHVIHRPHTTHTIVCLVPHFCRLFETVPNAFY